MNETNKIKNYNDKWDEQNVFVLFKQKKNSKQKNTKLDLYLIIMPCSHLEHATSTNSIYSFSINSSKQSIQK